MRSTLLAQPASANMLSGRRSHRAGREKAARFNDFDSITLFKASDISDAAGVVLDLCNPKPSWSRAKLLKSLLAAFPLILGSGEIDMVLALGAR